MQGNFTADPGLYEALFDLLDLVFPGLRQGAQEIRRLGIAWEAVSTPFVHFEHGKVVSHVGVIELPLVAMGRPVTVGSVHAVATHPDYRRRGYYDRRMRELLEYASGRWEALILTTEHPEYFTPFGFRHVPEQCFFQPVNLGRSDRLRPLNLRDSADVVLLHRLLDTREPVSQVVGVGPEKAVFCFNEARRPLYYAESLDALICLEREDSALHLYDIVTPHLPALQDLAAVLPGANELIFHFAPDRFAPQARAVPYLLDHDGPSYLMVRGPLAAEGEAFTLPRGART
ncbi:MAG: GNAT family N-acetyltransferase [Candidatus Zixiibacteriota bacterium]|nr:MAG: GNAT family N-acetyltransferase [candidate division Zixibacteria bacterium]